MTPRKRLVARVASLTLVGCTKTVVVQQPPSVSPECREWQIQYEALQDILAMVEDPGDRGNLVNEFYAHNPRPTGCEVPGE